MGTQLLKFFYTRISANVWTFKKNEKIRKMPQKRQVKRHGVSLQECLKDIPVPSVLFKIFCLFLKSIDKTKQARG